MLRASLEEQEWRLRTIHQLTREMASLRQMQNLTAPINSLQTEILVEIFTYLVDYKAGDTEHLLPVTHVCSLWRAVALSAPMLWTTVSINKVELAEELLPRSRTLPLSLILTTLQRTHRFVPLIVPHIHRLRVLLLHVSNERSMHRILTRLRTRAPKLEELSLKITCPFGIPNHYPAPFTSPFNGDIPSLRMLVTTNVDIMAPFTRPSALVHLHIRMNYELSECLIPTLVNCPLLETLTYAGPFFLDDVSADHVAELPKLRRLSACLIPREMHAFLSRISIPQSCQMDLNVSSGMAWGYNMLPKDAHLNLKCLSGIRRLEMHHSINDHEDIDDDDQDSTILLHAYRDVEAGAEKSLILNCRVNIFSPADLYGHWRFDVSQVEVLVLTGLTMSNDYGRVLRVNMFRSLPALKVLRAMTVHPPHAEALLDLLGCLEFRGPASDHTDEVDPEELPGDTQNVADSRTDAPGEEGETSSDKAAAVPLICPMLSTLELYDIPQYRELPIALIEVARLRQRGGILQEVDLFNVGCPHERPRLRETLRSIAPGMTLSVE